jgi:hypothetical protein
MKIGDRVKFTAESILWLYHEGLWPDSIGVIERERPAHQGEGPWIDVRFGNNVLVPNEPKSHFQAV